jgi:anti-anti-sigma regulatory factor
MELNDTGTPLAQALARPLPTVNLDEAEALQVAHLLPRSTPLHVDCAHLACQRTLGVGYVVSQLLLLRRAGATIWLRNVNAPLRNCLHLLGLSSLFHFGDLT